MTHAMEDGEVEKRREAAKRPIDEDPVFAEMSRKFQDQTSALTKLRGEKVNLENKNKLLEEQVDRLSKLVLAKILEVYKIEEVCPVPEEDNDPNIQWPEPAVYKMTTSPITLEQVNELLRELLDNAIILTEKEHSFVVWVATTLADGMPITVEHAKQVKAVYHQMINRQYGGGI